MSEVLQIMQPYIGPIITALITILGVYATVISRFVTMETQLRHLTSQVEKHNSVIERTFTLESDVRTLYKKTDRIEDKIDQMGEKA